MKNVSVAVICVSLIFFVQSIMAQTNPIGFGQSATPEEKAWAGDHYVDYISNQLQTITYFDYFHIPEGYDDPPEYHEELRDGCIRYIITEEGKLLCKIKLFEDIDSDVKDKFDLFVVTDWFHFGTRGRIFENTDGTPAVNLATDPPEWRHKGKPVDDIGPIRMISAKGNRVFALTEDGNLYLSLVADPATALYVRNDPHGSADWDENERERYEDNVMEEFKSFGIAVALKEVVVVNVEENFLWYQLEKPKLEYTDVDDNLIQDTIIDIAVGEIFKKTQYDRRYNADYHNPFSGMLRGDADEYDMVKYADFFDGVVTFFLLVKRVMNGDTVNPTYNVRWTDEHTYMMMTYGETGAWRDIDLRQEGWPKVKDIKIDPDSPTFQDLIIHDLLLMNWRDELLGTVGSYLVLYRILFPLSGNFPDIYFCLVKNQMAKSNLSFGRAMTQSFAIMTVIYFSAGTLAIMFPPTIPLGMVFYGWSAVNLILTIAPIGPMIDDINISAQGKFYQRFGHLMWNWPISKMEYADYKKEDRNYTVWPDGELEPYIWDSSIWWEPFTTTSLINDNSRIEATHEHLILSTEDGKIFSIAFNYGAVDYTWRSRDITPTDGRSLLDIGYSPENIRLRDDNTIIIKGIDGTEDGFYYQTYADEDEYYGYEKNPYGLPPPTGSEVSYNHGRDWAYSPADEFDENLEFETYDISSKPLGSTGETRNDGAGNNITYIEDPSQTTYRGINTSYMEKVEVPGEPVETVITPLNYMVVTNYINALPLEVLRYNLYMDLYYSINGADFIQANHIKTNASFDTIEDALDYYKDNEEPESSFYFDDKGSGLLVSPHFKEGYNSVVFRFTEPNDREVYKSMILMQLTIPPFIKPIYPLMNQYINTSDFGVVIQAQDIMGQDSQIKPEDWFVDALYTITLDNEPIINYTLEPADNTIRFNVNNLSDGNHDIRIEVDYLGLTNSSGWRFWVDTTPPEVRFPEKLIFSNQEQGSTERLSFNVSDTVPFYMVDKTYPVDTVFLTNVASRITDGSSPLLELDQQADGTLGFYMDEWDGWVDDQALQHGVYTYEVSAVDRVGNQGVLSTNVIIDNYAPSFDYINLSDTKLTLDSGFLDLNYQLHLDPWEEEGQVNIVIKNLSSNESFSMNPKSEGGVDKTWNLDQFSGGIGLLQDGIYDFSVYTNDEIYNKGDPVVFQNIVVDLTKPKILDAYANPFVLNTQNNNITLTFHANEENDVEENYSDVLDIDIQVLDQFGEPVILLTQTSLEPGTEFNQGFNFYSSLSDGKYFFEITAIDKNGNTRKEMVAFIKEAMPPEILLPEENDLLSGIETLYGNAGDPRWDNDLPFAHYELFYKTGIHSLPSNLSDLSTWESDCIWVPTYQQNDPSHPNRGYFPVEGNNVLGSFDTTLVPEGEVTVLLVAEEVGGYRIGTVRTYHILTSSVYNTVDVIIDSEYTQGTGTIDFSQGGNINVTYHVDHDFNNPVDVYTFIKDGTGKVVRQTSNYNLNSNEIIGQPSFGEEDSGVFVYQDEFNRFFVTLRNKTESPAEYNIMVNTSGEFLDFVDEAGNQIDEPNVLDGNMLSIYETLEPDQEYTIGFLTNIGSELSIIAMKDTYMTPIYLGINKTLSATGYVILYEGSTYPPVTWDGKDEWGRYVPNGIYIIGVEAYGNKGGYDQDTCQFSVLTPFYFEIESVDNNQIQPGLLSFESSTVQFIVNKGIELQVEVLDDQNIPIKSIYPGPEIFPHLGRYTFSWFGKDDSDQYAGPGTYSYKITCTPLDSNIPYIFDKNSNPELGEIQVILNQNLDSSVQAEIYPFTSGDEFGGRQVVRGDNSYEVLIHATGQNLPDKTVNVNYDVKGTQVVDAYPDMNYMAAFRTNYEELWARVKVNYIRVRVKYRYSSSTWGTHYAYETRDVPVNLFLEQDIASFDAINNQFTSLKNFSQSTNFSVSRLFPSTKSVYVGRQRWCFIICTPWEDVYKNATIYSVSYVYNPVAEVVSGIDYMSENVWASGTHLNSYSISSNRVTVNVSTTLNCYHNVSMAKYLSYADGVAVMGPNVVSENDYSKKTVFVNYAREFTYDNGTELVDEVPLIDNVLTSTGMSSNDYYSTHWRKNPRYLFYWIGENYVNADEYSEPRESVEDLFNYDGYETEQDYGGGASREDVPVILKARQPYLIPDDFVSQEFYDPSVSKVKFYLRKDGDGKYYVSVESLAKDKILYPFPTTSAGFDVSHPIGDSELNIPVTIINGWRSNDNADPNYIVPEYKLDTPGEKNVYFIDDVLHSFMLSFPISFDQETGYNGQLPLADMLAHSDSNLPLTVNEKKLENILLTTTSGDVQFSNIPDTLWNRAADDPGIVIADDNIAGIVGVDWFLEDDTHYSDDSSITSGKQLIDVDWYNRYGVLKEERIKDFYTFSSTNNTDPLNMFHTLNGEYTDNTDIIIHPEVKDYSNTGLESGYQVDLVGIDGKPFKGLQIKDLVHFGKGFKLSDAYILEKSAESPVMLVPVYGIAEGDFQLNYKTPDGAWIDIPINTNPAVPEVLTYWDVTGLNGLHTIRLVSSIDGGNRVNVDLKEIYIGQKVDTNTEDIFLSSPDGQAKLILPQNSISEEAVISIDTVDFETLQDIAVLPAIAPIGEVIKLSPDGLQFTNEQAYPQLQFTYNKEELDEQGLNPVNLTIYNLKDNGDLEPINTIKQLIKVEYNEAGLIQSEEVLWDSATSTLEDISGIDYTYVRAYAVITHFSYYVVLEGNIDNMPKIDQENTTTSDTLLMISGSGRDNEEIHVYVTQSPILKLDGTLQPVATTQSDYLGNFVIENVPLVYEGKNFIFIGYDNSLVVEYKKIIIIRDTTAPVINISGYQEIISPNNDGLLDTTKLTLSSSEKGILSFIMTAVGTGGVVNEQSIQVNADEEINILIDGFNQSGSLLNDGEYSIIITGADELGNMTAEYIFAIKMDTYPPVMQIGAVTPVHMKLSPANDDGNYDDITVELAANEKAVLNIWIVDDEENESIKLGENITADTNTTFVWTGKTTYQYDVPDGNYYIKVNASDSVGNSQQIIFSDKPIVIDNTGPTVVINNIENEIVVVPAPYEISTIIDEPGASTIQVIDGTGNAIHNIGEPSVSGENHFLWNIPEEILDGIYTVTIIVTDELNNVSSPASYTIEITHDITPPELTVPPDIIVEATNILTIVDIGQATAEDISPPIEITNNALEEYPLGDTIVTWHAVDRYGNESTQDQKITIVDTTPPLLTTPDNITQEATDVLTPVVLGLGTASDIFDVTIENDAPEDFPLGMTAVTWRAEDENGNISENIQLVMIVDTTPPVLTLPPDITVTANGLENYIDIGVAAATDIFTVVITNNAPEFYGLGDTEITWTATDTSGNNSLSIQTISVVDTIPPVITTSGIIEGGDYTDSVTPLLIIMDNESGIQTSNVELDGVPYTSGTPITTPGDHTIIANGTDYAGNTSFITITFKIYSSTELSITANAIEYSDSTSIVATLMKLQNPLPGKTITFTFDGVVIGTQETQANGKALLSYVIMYPTGNYEIGAHFVQDEVDFLRPSEATTGVQVMNEKTSVLYTGDYLIQYGNYLTLQAQVDDEDDGYPGDRTKCKVKFDVNKVDELGVIIFIDSYIIQCDESGIATTSQIFDVGVYSIDVSVVEEGYYATSTNTALVVIYDPAGGFATGGGWIEVTNPDDGDLGRANFGFNAKYKNGQPTGHLNFHYKDGDIKLKSKQVDWLVMSATGAQFEGTGAINNMLGDFTFRISCTDNDGNPQEDKFTITIWAGTDTEADPVYKALNQDLGGGNIKMHTN